MSLKSYLQRKKFWFDDWCQGSPLWNAYREIKQMNNDMQFAMIQREMRLRELLAYAQKNTLYYSHLTSLNLSDFPVVNKLIIMEDFDKFTPPFTSIPFQKGNLHIHHTSGSTGIPFEFPQDTKCRIKRLATIKYYNDTIGFHSFDPLAHIRSLKQYYNETRDIIYNSKLNITYIDNSCLNEQKAYKIIQEINSKKIKFIRGYMSSLDYITRFAVDNNILLRNHPFFISVGEPLLESLRIRVIKELHCHIISQYASEELGIMGQTDIDGHGTEMNINKGVILEVLNMEKDIPAADGELGRLVVTDLTNYALPLIRYEIGDVAAIVKRNGNIIERVNNLTGRKTDIIYRPNGSPIDIQNSLPTEIFLNKGIAQWQFIQTGKKDYTLKLLLKNKNLISEEALFKQYLNEILGPEAQIKIIFTNDIPVLNSGKRRLIINEYNK